MRDIIRLFSDRDSRDELGLGQIRDALSDALFPGTSTLHTRARYLLFIPWVYQLASRSKDPVAEADRLERKLIATLRTSDDYAGLLGLQAGTSLKTLPSSIYWSMLRRYSILREPSLSQRDVLSFDGRALGLDELDSLGDNRFRAWSTTMPAPPATFPNEVSDGFALRAEEAGWLRDRIFDEAPGTFLAHLIVHRPEPDSAAPWLDASALALEGEAKEILDHARTFSTVMQGAQLLYNIILAEQYESAGSDGIDLPGDGYRERLEHWAATLPGVVDVHGWRSEDLLARVAVVRGAPVHPRSAQFLRDWLTFLRETDLAKIVHDDAARALIVRREKQSKGAQARIGNLRRLQTWGGSSGAGALAFRWPNVRRLVTDIHDGFARVDEDDNA